MRVGIPKGLLYCKYHPFFQTFFRSLGAEIILSEETNKKIMNWGVQTCVDEACLPVKIFHGHVAALKEHCDLMVIPRIMRVYEQEFICPKFCGLPEMVMNSIPGLPPVTTDPLYMDSEKGLHRWCQSIGSMITRDKKKIFNAFRLALRAQCNFQSGICQPGNRFSIMLAGHPYILFDQFLNMGIVHKLRSKGIGIVTEEFANEAISKEQVKTLIKKPFWTFQRRLYGAAAALVNQHKIDGIIYLSSFACGIDSVIIDLIRYRIGEYPMLILKLDEHTGEAGIDTRLEAFIDMLERRSAYDNYRTSSGECLYRSENPV